MNKNANKPSAPPAPDSAGTFRRFPRQAIMTALFLLFSFPAPAQTPSVTADEFRDIRRVSEMIVRKYPPEIYTIVGVGRSSTPFIAYLQDMHPKSKATMLPLSDFQYKPGELSGNELKILTSHFDLFLPSKKQLGAKKILLIDYIDSGKTLLSAQHYITDYYQRSGTPTQVEALGLTQDRIGSTWEAQDSNKLFHQKMDIIRLPRDSTLATKIRQSEYKYYSPYGAWRISSPTPMSPANISPNYLSFVIAMRRQVPENESLFSKACDYLLAPRVYTIQSQ